MYTFLGLDLTPLCRCLGCTPMCSFKGGIGRHAQAKLLNTPGSQACWPQKASKIVLDLLTNAESNAEVRQSPPTRSTTHGLLSIRGRGARLYAAVKTA